ncbi:MAG TPA: response regulator [Fibrobacteres bacterium]|jgi:two-component system, sensor histidine kinase SagS|nr:response regulator [Fibrobacterota bacterium]
MNYSEKNKNRRILIVDDEVDVLDFLKIYLSSLDWDVSIASNIKTAFGELDAKTFFLVITDIAMPEMDGHEFISKLREKRIPSEVALMTGFGYNPKHTLVKIYKEVKCPCLFKPFNRVKVAETIQAAWEHYHETISGQ